MLKIICFLFSLQVLQSVANVLPVKKCLISDSDCLRELTQAFVPKFTKGIPEFGIEQLDEMNIDHIHVNLAGLLLDVKNIKIRGLKDSTIDKFSIDMDTKEINLVYTADTTLKGQYVSSGKLLTLPFHGNGDVTIETKKIRVNLTMPFEVIKNKDDKQYLQLKSSRFTFDILDNIHLEITNLFDGDKELGDAMNDVINKNWRVLSDEFGPSLLEKAVANVYKSIKKYYKAQSLKEIGIIIN